MDNGNSSRKNDAASALDRVAEAFPGAARINPPASKKRLKWGWPEFKTGFGRRFDREMTYLHNDLDDDDPVVARRARRVIMAMDAISKARIGHLDVCLCGYCSMWWKWTPLDLKYAWLLVAMLDSPYTGVGRP